MNRKEVKQLERFIRKEFERIVFNTKRPSGRPKRNGKHFIQDKTGDLRRSIRKSRNFIVQGRRGLEIRLVTMKYFKYLDDQRRDELNWYLTEAFFDDPKIIAEIRRIKTQSLVRVTLREVAAILQ